MKNFVSTILICLAFLQANAQGEFYPADNQTPAYNPSYWEGDFDSTKVKSAIRTTWIANRPSSNWFFGVNGGVSWFRSENWRDIDMKDKLRFTGGFQIGRWFNPVWGARANVSFANLTSYSPDPRKYSNDAAFYVGQNHPNIDGNRTPRTYIEQSHYSPNYQNDANSNFIWARFLAGEKEYKNGYLYDFTYGGISLDFLLNLKSVFRPYNPNGFFNPVLFVGLGWAHTFTEQSNDVANADRYALIGFNNEYIEKDLRDYKGNRSAVNSIMNRMGFEWQFRLSRHFDIVLTLPEVIMVPEVFDRQVGGNQTQDLLINAGLGVTYHFGEPRFVASVCPGDVAALNEDVNKRRCNPCCTPCCVPCCMPCCNPCQHQHPKPQPQHECCNHPFDPANPDHCSCNCHKLHQQPQAPEPKPEKPKTLSLTPVFFDLDKYVIRDDQKINIARAALYLDENPKATLEIAAYADVQTGNPKHNWKLSENRVNAVAKVLMKQYGINPNRLTLKFYGDTVQPYQINELNRVAIFVKESEKIKE